MDVVPSIAVWLSHGLLIGLAGSAGFRAAIYQWESVGTSEAQLRRWKREGARLRLIAVGVATPLVWLLGRFMGYMPYRDLAPFLTFGIQYGSPGLLTETMFIVAAQLMLSYLGGYVLMSAAIKADQVDQKRLQAA